MTEMPLSVLIVEDDILVRMNASSILSDSGFHVYEAASAGQALETLDNIPVIDVLFTDIKMPGSMDGESLAAEVKLRWPDVRIVLTSGRTHDEVVPMGMRFIAKPYTDEELLLSMG